MISPFKGSESNKINIFLKKASHRQKQYLSFSQGSTSVQIQFEKPVDKIDLKAYEDKNPYRKLVYVLISRLWREKEM